MTVTVMVAEVVVIEDVSTALMLHGVIGEVVVKEIDRLSDAVAIFDCVAPSTMYSVPASRPLKSPLPAPVAASMSLRPPLVQLDSEALRYLNQNEAPPVGSCLLYTSPSPRDS